MDKEKKDEDNSAIYKELLPRQQTNEQHIESRDIGQLEGSDNVPIPHPPFWPEVGVPNVKQQTVIRSPR
jgi:hypothetical protein